MSKYVTITSPIFSKGRYFKAKEQYCLIDKLYLEPSCPLCEECFRTRLVLHYRIMIDDIYYYIPEYSAVLLDCLYNEIDADIYKRIEFENIQPKDWIKTYKELTGKDIDNTYKSEHNRMMELREANFESYGNADPKKAISTYDILRPPIDTSKCCNDINENDDNNSIENNSLYLDVETYISEEYRNEVYEHIYSYYFLINNTNVYTYDILNDEISFIDLSSYTTGNLNPGIRKTSDGTLYLHATDSKLIKIKNDIITTYTSDMLYTNFEVNQFVVMPNDNILVLGALYYGGTYKTAFQIFDTSTNTFTTPKEIDAGSQLYIRGLIVTEENNIVITYQKGAWYNYFIGKYELDTDTFSYIATSPGFSYLLYQGKLDNEVWLSSLVDGYENGLGYYDGTTITYIDNTTTPSIPDKRVGAIYVDKINDIIWFLCGKTTATAKLCKYDRLLNTIQLYDAPHIVTQYTSILPLESGNFIVSYETDYIYKFDIETGLFTTFHFIQDYVPFWGGLIRYDKTESDIKYLITKEIKRIYGENTHQGFSVYFLENINNEGYKLVLMFNETYILIPIITGDKSRYTYLWNTGETTETIIPTASGVYTIKVTDDLGCTKEASILVIKIDEI